jgi:hypothetical protein
LIDLGRELRDGIPVRKLTIPYKRGVEFDVWPIRCFMDRFDIFLVIIFCRQWLANLIWGMMGFFFFKDCLLLPFPLVFDGLLGQIYRYRFFLWF